MLVTKLYDLIDEGDFAGVIAMFASDSEYRRPGYEPLVGRSALDHFYRSVRLIDSGQHTLEQVLATGSDVAVFGSFRGVLKDGKEINHRFAERFRLEGELIAYRETFFAVPHV